MSIHRGIPAAVVLSLALVMGACMSDSEPDPPRTTTTPTTTTPETSASEDPAAQAVPLAGDNYLTIDWTLDKGVNASDPVVDVGRRTLAVVYLATFSPTWRSDDAISKISTSLTIGDGVLLEPTRSARTTKRPAAKDPLVITVQSAKADGDTAMFWACVDARGPYDGKPTRRTNIGVLASVSLTAVDGVWKATKYDLNPTDSTSDQRYYERCQQAE